MSIDNATPAEWDRAAQAAQTAAKWAETGFSLQTLNAHLYRPFGEVAMVDQCLAFALWRQGFPVQWLSNGDWIDSAFSGISWNPATRYRVLPKPEEPVLPSIDWSHVAPKWKWLAQDENGSVWIYTRQPQAPKDQPRWIAQTGQMHRCAEFTSCRPGRGDWRKLIVQRPEGV